MEAYPRRKEGEREEDVRAEGWEERREAEEESRELRECVLALVRKHTEENREEKKEKLGGRERIGTGKIRIDTKEWNERGKKTKAAAVSAYVTFASRSRTIMDRDEKGERGNVPP